MNKKIFENLFVLDLANNHFGDVKHAAKVINHFSKVIKKLKATIKFQFRNLEKFIHPNYINSDEKYVKRFLSTKLSNSNFENYINLLKK